MICVLCPHHPDDGFPGEVKELKILCECRMPGTGMLRRAAEDLNIDLLRSYMVGNSAKDIEAGKLTGFKTALIIGDGRASPSGARIAADFAEDTFLGAINRILEDA